MIKYLFFLLSLGSVVIAQLLLKKGVNLISDEFSSFNIFSLIPKVLTNIYLLSGLSFLGIGFLSWLFVLSRFKLAMVYPISTSSAMALVVILSWLFFRESLQAIQILGVGLIIFGIFLLVK